MPDPLWESVIGVRIAAIPISGMAGMKNVTLTSAPEIGAPLESASFTRNTLPPLWGGLGSEVSCTFALGAFIVEVAPAPGGGGTNDPIAAWSWLSESIRKFAEVTMRSPAFRPFSTMY